MTILADRQIRQCCVVEKSLPLIATSHGLSSYGYDIKLGSKFGTYCASDEILVPRAVPDADVAWHDEDEFFILPAHSFCLAASVEYFIIPNDVVGMVMDKSTYARAGISVQTTIIEAGWEGILTLGIYNALPRPVQLTVGEGIAQIIFPRAYKRCRVSYADRKGKYQKQTGVTLPRGG